MYVRCACSDWLVGEAGERDGPHCALSMRCGRVLQEYFKKKKGKDTWNLLSFLQHEIWYFSSIRVGLCCFSCAWTPGLQNKRHRRNRKATHFAPRCVPYFLAILGCWIYSWEQTFQTQGFTQPLDRCFNWNHCEMPLFSRDIDRLITRTACIQLSICLEVELSCLTRSRFSARCFLGLSPAFESRYSPWS